MIEEVLLKPMDVVRARALKWLGKTARPFIIDRELRVAAAGSLVIVAALLGALVLPLWMLALGPLIWGIPHILSDVRYLVVRPGHHKRWPLVLAVGAPLAVAALGGGVVAGLCAAMGVFLVARCSAGRRAAGLVGIGALMAGALWAGSVSEIIFAHAHNFIAVALWWAWRPRQGRWHWWPLGLFVVGSVLLALGVLDPFIGVQLQRDWGFGWMDGRYFATLLAPGSDAQWGLRLVLLFAFAQAVHYGIWLRMMPDEDRPQRTPRSFLATWKALEADFGRWPLRATVLGCAALAAWAAFDLAGARLGYLRMANFHGHLELAAGALIFAEGRLRS
mgnify:CR=1 FL=1